MIHTILNIVIGLIAILSASYAVFTLLLKFYWNKIQPSTSPTDPTEYITVIIPVRNEEDNIANLIRDLNQQTYPKDQFEVLIMNDNSTDNTLKIIQEIEISIDLKVITLPDEPTTAPKKRAIETAMTVAKGDLIVCTDGDCRVSLDWLRSFAVCHQSTGAKFISGPVTFTDEKTLTDYLQTVEFSSLMGSGASAIQAGFPSLCNGANLAYEKNTFQEVSGYDGVRHIASGDDEFLMHKIAAKYPQSVVFLKDQNAIVQTEAHQEWKMFFRQRKRWASKWKHYQTKTPLILALYIFLCNFSQIVTLAFFAFDLIDVRFLGSVIALKVIPEWLFLGSVLEFLKKNKSIWFIPVTQLIYPFYVCFFGLAAQKPEYNWKGRKLK